MSAAHRKHRTRFHGQGKHLAYRQLLWEEQGGRCIYCGRRMKFSGKVGPENPRRATTEHIMPLALGGDDNDSNICLACHACNQLKGGMHPADFIARIWGVQMEVAG